LFDLLLEQFSQEFAKLVKSDFSRLIVIKYTENNLVTFLEISTTFTITRMDTFQKSLNEGFNFLLFQGTTIISINGIKNTFVNL
jgi:hypothetical protein